jgi:hypothetical protein
MGIYIGSFVLFKNYFDVTYLTVDFLLRVLLLTAICWLPIHILKVIIGRIDPSEEAKVKKT